MYNVVLCHKYLFILPFNKFKVNFLPNKPRLFLSFMLATIILPIYILVYITVYTCIRSENSLCQSFFTRNNEMIIVYIELSKVKRS